MGPLSNEKGMAGHRSDPRSTCRTSLFRSLTKRRRIRSCRRSLLRRSRRRFRRGIAQIYIYIYTFMCATILSYSIPKSNKWITWLYFKWSFWDGCGIKWLQYMRGFIKLRHVSTWAVGGADRQSCYVCNCVCVSLESNNTKLNPCLVQVRIFGEG